MYTSYFSSVSLPVQFPHTLFKPSVASFSASSRFQKCGQRYLLCMQRALLCSRVVGALRPFRKTSCFPFSCKAVLIPRSRSLLRTLAPPSAAVLSPCRQSSARRGLDRSTVRIAASASKRACSSVRVANGALCKAAANLPCSANGCSGRGSIVVRAQEAPLSAYLHLPFCKKKCFYCDFPVVALGSALPPPAAQHRFQDYVDLLVTDLQAAPVAAGSPALQTVFFGGGTPSLIPPPLLEQVLGALRAKFGIANDAEVSMEADPGTFDADRLRAYMAAGVTRFSIGVQAFQQGMLEACGRSHGLGDAEAALAAVTAAKPSSWSLDLISGLPDLGREQWRHSLRRAIAAGAPHISVYDLQVEAGTPFGRWHDAGRLRLPTDDEGAAMYSDASRMLLEAGYEHYELSNYALPGHQCRHNLTYWSGSRPFYGFGLGAASCLEGRRASRPRTMDRYRGWVRAGCHEEACTSATDAGDAADRLLDTVMLQLRLSAGLDLDDVADSHGDAAAAVVRAAVAGHAKRGLVEEFAGPRGESRLRLSDPEGFLLSNDIISDVFAALESLGARENQA